MLKITSFSALIVGLLLAAPMVLSDASAGRAEATGSAMKADRASSARQIDDRLTAAFALVGEDE